MNREKKILLALLLIRKGAPFNNSYYLMRILEWKFQIIESKEILDIIKIKEYASFELVNSVHFYKLTDIGKDFIKIESTDITLNFIVTNYPEERDFILHLLG